LAGSPSTIPLSVLTSRIADIDITPQI